jgi:hypothetical protein
LLRGAADHLEKIRGTVLTIDGIALTLEVEGGATRSFVVDAETRVEARGAGTATRRALNDGRRGVALSDILSRGNAVEVTYHEHDGVLRAMLIRRIASIAGAPISTPRDPLMTKASR